MHLTVKMRKAIITIVFIFGFFASCLDAKTQTPLPVSQAFVINAQYQAPHLFIHWQIAPHYYLYRDKFKITANNDVLATQFPPGDLKYAQDRGRFEVYKNTLTLSVTLKPADAAQLIQVTYQGCAEDGFCYPPMQKTIQVQNDQALVLDQVAAKPSYGGLLTNQNQIAMLFQSHYWPVTFLLFLGLGLLLAFTPCVLPMIPILTSIIVGQDKTVNVKKAFLLSLTYVMGVALTYALAGLVAALLGNSLQVWLQKPTVIAMVSLMFVLLAFSLFDVYHLRLPKALQNVVNHLPNRFQGGSYIGVFMMGVISILIVSPCVTAPLVGVLMYIGQSGDVVLGASALFAIGLGMGLPLLLLGVSAGRWLPRRGPWMELVKMAFGILMLAMAVWLFARILPGRYTLMLWGGFLFLLALGVGFYQPKYYKRYHLNRILAFILSLAGFGLLLTYSVGPESMKMGLVAENRDQHQMKFVVVKNLAALNKRLQAAAKNKQPVLLDYYADWCESCLALERHVFADPSVQAVLSQAHFKLLRVDLSENTADDEVLLQHFQVYAPPTILFFDRKGQELKALRIVGEVSQSEFLAQLANIQKQI